MIQRRWQSIFNSLDDIKNAFKINYSESNLGLPIFVRDITKNNSVFTLTISSGRDHPNMLPDQQDQGEEFRRMYYSY